MTKTPAAKLTLGPVLFNWAPDKWRDFYLRIADEAPVDAVCVGEVVCSKRVSLHEPVLAGVIERLQAAGKEVVLSTLALIMDENDMDTVRALAAADDFLVEANDIAAAALLGGRPHAIGPFVNVYNEGTLGYLARRGAVRVALPVELDAVAIAALAGSTDAELEVQTFGRLPLALSARCYHARAHGLHKDGCQYVCGEDADGMELRTLDGDPFLAVNGTQTLSYTYGNLVGELAALQAMGVRRFRLSPQDIDMVAVARVFRDVLEGRQAPPAALEALGDLAGGKSFCNGFHHGTVGAELVAASAPPE